MKVFKDFDLINYNSYNLSAKCKHVFFPENEADVQYLYQQKQNYILLGSGHNIILSKALYEEDFIIFNGNFNKCNINNSGLCEAEAGVSMLEISELALKQGFSGVEIFYDIPSSLGGAVVMNAGAGGEEIKDILVKVRYLDLVDMHIKEIFRDEMEFQYRNSFFQKNKNKIILKAWLQLQSKDKDFILKKMETTKIQRSIKQPKEFPNAGSVFKRPKGYYVGAIIDELGLKGFTIGGAKISEKHGGFIVNFNNATGLDIINIIEEVKKQILEKYNLDIEVEQRII